MTIDRVVDFRPASSDPLKPSTVFEGILGPGDIETLSTARHRHASAAGMYKF